MTDAEGYSLRPASPGDVELLTDVVVEATRDQDRWPADVDEAAFRREHASWTAAQLAGAADPHSTISVIERAGEAVGRLRVVRDGHRIELAGIQLRPNAQGHGIGTAIVDALKREAARAAVPLELSVEHDNPRARALYERLGFLEIGHDAREAHLRWRPTGSSS